MKILALETSTTTPAFATVELDENLAVLRATTRVIEQSRALSSEIMLSISSALDEAGWSLDDVDAIAVSIGPGSWTGLRIGLTTAKTLAQTRGLPLIGVPTLDAVVQEAQQHQQADNCFYIAIEPCRAGEVYFQAWCLYESHLMARHEVRIAAPQQLADEILSAAPAKLVMISTCGAGMRAMKEVTTSLHDFSFETCEVIPEALVCNLARLAAQKLKSGERDDPLLLSPLYLAPSNAERVWAEKIAREQANETAQLA